MVTVQKVGRGDIYLVELDPTRGQEIRKTRPCLVVSPDELNEHARTFIVAPRSRPEVTLTLSACHAPSKANTDTSCSTNFAPWTESA